jgi:FkbH-like protein
MILRLSRFVHPLPLGGDRLLVIHAVTHLRLRVDPEIAALIAAFAAPRDVREALSDLSALLGYDVPTLAGCVGQLMERGVLTAESPEAELAAVTTELGDLHGRDPGEMLDRFRREAQEGANPYWAVAAPLGVADLKPGARRVDLLLFGDCDVQMEADFLRRAAMARGLDLRIAASFPDDVRAADERAHDAILIGALRARRAIAEPTVDAATALQPYLAEARWLIEALRRRTAAPILIDGLPEPTVQPLGLADRGPGSHRNRFRQANLALEQIAAEHADVYVVDVAATLGAAGGARLLDDGLVGFTHFGSPGWLLQRPDAEKAAVHGLFPDLAPLAASIGGDPYAREKIMAEAHADMLLTVLGVGSVKCVIVDLDGVLWPGVLAETGSPFGWDPEVSGPFSYVGLYFGIHEALKALQRRGILLACVSKNDEALVRELWTYPDHYPRERLLTLDDFVTHRINWDDKAQNIASIAEDLGFALDAFAFIDDHPVERARARAALPDMPIFGDDLFALRRQLLTDPRLQRAAVTAEAGARTELTKAQLQRARLKADLPDETAFRAMLAIDSASTTLGPGADVGRVAELFARTTQFNTTGRKFTVAELNHILTQGTGQVFTLRASDRFGDYGLVAAAVVVDAAIEGFVMSCRVIGLGLEQKLLAHVLDAFAARKSALTAQIVPTSRNLPVRNLYRDHGFTALGDGLWSKPCDASRSAA